MAAIRLATITLLVFAAGCRGDRLSMSAAGLVVEPAAIEFAPAFVGYPVTATATLRNTSRVTLQATFEVQAPFTAPEALEVPAGSSVPFEVVFMPEAEGAAEGALTVRWDDDGSAEVSLTATARLAPSCPAAGDCESVRFDSAQGQCVREPLVDGTACSGNLCLTAGHCLAGQCVGASVSCDDADACTRDSCDPARGCLHDDVSASCPKPPDACQVATCFAQTGCGFAVAADGTACGPNDCHTAQVCMAGACETRVPPEGSACSEPTLCRGPGVCRAMSCVDPAPFPLTPAWTYSPAAGRQLRYGGQLDADGNAYFVEGDAALTELVSLNRAGQVRFRSELRRNCGSCVYYADFALDPAGQRLYLISGRRAQARSLADGRLLWDQDLSAGLPVYNPTPDGGASISAYQPVLLGSDLIGFQVLEGYTDHNAYVTVLDRATGTLAWRIHKKGHLYGSGATANGELWLSSANCWAPAGELNRVSATGQVLASRFLQAIPGAYGANEGWANSNSEGLVLSSSLVDRKMTMPAGHRAATQSALLSNDRIVLLTTNYGSQQSVTEFDPQTLQARWSTPVGQAASSLDTLLTTDGGVLTLGRNTDGGGFVLALDSNGAEQLRCPLPAGLWALGSGRPGSRALRRPGRRYPNRRDRPARIRARDVRLGHPAGQPRARPPRPVGQANMTSHDLRLMVGYQY